MSDCAAAASYGEDLAVGGGLPLLRVLRLVAHAGIAAVLGEFLVGDALTGRRSNVRTGLPG